MNLKSFREDKLKIKSVAEFAKLLEVDPEKLTEWESDPNICPFQIVQKIMEKIDIFPNILDIKRFYDRLFPSGKFF